VKIPQTSFGNQPVEGKDGRESYSDLTFYKSCFSGFGCLVGHWDKFNVNILEDGYRPSRNGQDLEKVMKVNGHRIRIYLTDGWNYVLDKSWYDIFTKDDAERQLSDRPSYSWNVGLQIGRRHYVLAEAFGATFPYPEEVRERILREIKVLSTYGLVFTAYFHEDS